jgi:hypothetical protein
MWWVAAAAAWLIGASAVALVLGAVVRRSHGAVPAAVLTAGPAADPAAVRRAPEPVAVPAQRSGPPPTPPHGLRSQGHLSCVASVRPRR